MAPTGPHSPSTQRSIPQISNIATNPPLSLRKRERFQSTVAIRTISEFKTVHREKAERLDRYLAVPRRNYKRLASGVADELPPSEAMLLLANNIEGRITFAETLLRHVSESSAIEAGPRFFVSIVSTAFMVPMHEALVMTTSEVNKLIFRLQQLARQALRGVPFVGMVEPALYKGWGPDGPTLGRDSLFWHCHLITWGRDRPSVAQAKDRIGKRHHSLVRGPAVNIRTVSADEIEAFCIYLSKAPLKEYRLNPKKGEAIDEETGEVFRTYGFLQQKREMRTGDRVLVANAMKGLKLDYLLFGGGSGRAIAEAIKKEVRAPAIAEEKLQARHRFNPTRRSKSRKPQR